MRAWREMKVFSRMIPRIWDQPETRDETYHIRMAAGSVEADCAADRLAIELKTLCHRSYAGEKIHTTSLVPPKIG